MKEDSNKKVIKNEDILEAKEEAKDLFNKLTDEQLKQVAGGCDPGWWDGDYPGDVREDLSLGMINNEYAAGEVDIDGWA